MISQSNKTTEKFKICEVEDKYVKYLYTFDSKVHRPDNSIYAVSLKYFSEVNRSLFFIYVIPLSSDKNKIYLNLDDNLNTIEKMKSPGSVSSPSQYFGVALISSQIPINLNADVIKPYTLDPAHNKYDKLLIQEKDWADKYRDDIHSKAQNCLMNKISYEERQHVCNFKLLERAVKVYDATNILVRERIQAYPKTFSEKENNEFFNKMENSLFKNKSNESGQGGFPSDGNTAAAKTKQSRDDTKVSADLWKQIEEAQRLQCEKNIEANMFSAEHDKTSSKSRTSKQAKQKEHDLQQDIGMQMEIS